MEERKGQMEVSRFTVQGKVRAPVAQDLAEVHWLRGLGGIYPTQHTQQCRPFLKILPVG